MEQGIKMLQNTLMLQYTSFVEGRTDIPWLTSIEKFQTDLEQLLAAGYESLSLEEAKACRDDMRDYPEKSFCLGFWGGYLNNYTLAYPILKKLKIKASIFISPEYIEKSGVVNGEERISWQQAQIMVDSGLISIYPLWNDHDIEKDFEQEINNKIQCISNHINRNNASFAVAFNNKELASFSSDYLRHIGFQMNVAYRYNLSAKDIKNGTVLSFRVDAESDVLDTFAVISSICEMNFARDITVVDVDQLSIELDENIIRETIKLPIDKNPIVKNYMRHAVPLSIIQAYSKDKAELFVLSECIEVTFKPWEYWFDYHNHSYEYWKNIKYRQLSRDIIEANDINIVHYIINGLKAQYYSDIWLDTYYIPHKPGYKKEHKTHGILIYGFDASSKMFNAISYTDQGHYEIFDVDIKSIVLGCSTQYFVYINLLGNNPVDFSSIDIKNIYTKLYNYSKSIFYDDDTCFTKKAKNQYYNYEACLKFAEFIKETSQKFHHFPITMIYSYIEHKKIMAWRLKYIAIYEKFYIANINEFESSIKKLMNASIKLNVKYSKKLSSEVVKMIKSINYEESILINQVISQLQRKYKFQ